MRRLLGKLSIWIVMATGIVLFGAIGVFFGAGIGIAIFGAATGGWIGGVIGALLVVVVFFYLDVTKGGKEMPKSPAERSQDDNKARAEKLIAFQNRADRARAMKPQLWDRMGR